MDISVIVPLFNEAESLPLLYEWIARVMKENRFSYEVIFVNDGSTDNSWREIEKLRVESQESKDERRETQKNKSLLKKWQNQSLLLK